MNKPPMVIYHIYSPMHIRFYPGQGDDSDVSSHISGYPPHLAELELLSDISNHDAVVLGDAAPPLSPELVSGLRQSAVITQASPPPMDAAGDLLADLVVKSDTEGVLPSLMPDQAGVPLSAFAGIEHVVLPDSSVLSSEARGLRSTQLGEAAPPAETQLSPLVV
jgi:hypothetical protein